MGKTLKDRNTPDRMMRQKENGWKRTTQTHEDKRKIRKTALCRDCKRPYDECFCD